MSRDLFTDMIYLRNKILLPKLCFTLGYVNQQATVSPKVVVVTQLATDWTGNWIFLKITSRYTVMFWSIMLKMHVNSCNNNFFRKRLKFVTFILGVCHSNRCCVPHINRTYTIYHSLNGELLVILVISLLGIGGHKPIHP